MLNPSRFSQFFVACSASALLFCSDVHSSSFGAGAGASEDDLTSLTRSFGYAAYDHPLSDPSSRLPRVGSFNKMSKTPADSKQASRQASLTADDFETCAVGTTSDFAANPNTRVSRTPITEDGKRGRALDVLYPNEVLRRIGGEMMHPRANEIELVRRFRALKISEFSNADIKAGVQLEHLGMEVTSENLKVAMRLQSFGYPYVQFRTDELEAAHALWKIFGGEFSKDHMSALISCKGLFYQSGALEQSVEEKETCLRKAVEELRTGGETECLQFRVRYAKAHTIQEQVLTVMALQTIGVSYIDWLTISAGTWYLLAMGARDFSQTDIQAIIYALKHPTRAGLDVNMIKFIVARSRKEVSIRAF